RVFDNEIRPADAERRLSAESEHGRIPPHHRMRTAGSVEGMESGGDRSRQGGIAVRARENGVPGSKSRTTLSKGALPARLGRRIDRAIQRLDPAVALLIADGGHDQQ